MAFWGAVVKSGKPFTLAANEARGINRLHLSRATLGYGDASPKSTLQCNVGPYCPILLCILTPSKVESCELNLEFEEAHEVTFSVIGPRSIHLSGYFPRSPDFRQSSDESEPYGEDINYTDMERSSGDDYDYSDSFINDDVLSGCGSHVLSSDHDEISTKELAAKTTDKERKEGRGGRLRKKFRTSDETSVRANDDSINDDSIQAFNIDNDYKISKVLSSEIPLTLENGKPSAKCENKTLEATVHTNKTVETGEPSENCEKMKIFEATTYTHWSLAPREDDVELSPIWKGCEILVKSLVVNNSEDGEGPESLQNEKEIKSSSDDVLPSPNATLTKTKRKMDMGDETLFECSERKKQAIDKNMEKEDGGAKEPLETEIPSNKVMTEHTEKGKLEETSAVKSDG